MRQLPIGKHHPGTGTKVKQLGVAHTYHIQDKTKGNADFMSTELTSSSRTKSSSRSVLYRARRPLIFILLTIGLIWLIPALLPEDSGWRLGLPFRIFYTAISLFGGIFFVLLESNPPRKPTTGLGVIGWISSVYILSVGLLVGIGMIFPNFVIPAEEISIGQTAAERGESLFFDSATTCILCHAVDGQGGTRGPDLAGIATRAGSRIEGMDAQTYLRESITDPTAYIVDGFQPIMPPGLINVIGEENIDDLIAFLLTLE